jgi:hypothetical protein
VQSIEQTNTTTTQSGLPVYLFHTPERPFCFLPTCPCHENQKEIAKLLLAVQNGELTLRNAADLTSGRMV